MFTIHSSFTYRSPAVVFLPPEKQKKHERLQPPCVSGASQLLCASDAMQVVLVVLEQQPVPDLVKSQGCGKEQLVS